MSGWSQATLGTSCECGGVERDPRVPLVPPVRDALLGRGHVRDPLDRSGVQPVSAREATAETLKLLLLLGMFGVVLILMYGAGF